MNELIYCNQTIPSQYTGNSILMELVNWPADAEKDNYDQTQKTI